MKLYPVKIECLDVRDQIFTAETFDEFSCSIKIDSLVGRGNIDEICAKIKEAVFMLTEPIEEEKENFK